MIIVLTDKALTKKDVQKAREEYAGYIKITADLKKGLVALGGEYHADAEEILVKKYGCRSVDIWGGGYSVNLAKFEVNAILNIKPGINDSPDILDPRIREAFLRLVGDRLEKIKMFL